MHVDQETVVSVNLCKFILVEVTSLDVVLDVNTFMGQYHVWVSFVISWSLKIVNLEVLAFLVLINAEVKIAFCCNFSIGIVLKTSQFFLIQLLFQSKLGGFLSNDFTKHTLNFEYFTMISFFRVA